MHDDIAKFWEDSGKQIIHSVSTMYETWFYYLPNPSNAKFFLAVKKQDSIAYFINERWLTEQEALRLIKLKVFL